MTQSLFPFSDSCTSLIDAHFSEGETILTIGDGNSRIGVLLSGTAHVSLINEDGQEIVIENLEEGDAFGENLMMPVFSQYYLVIADSECAVSFINYKNVMFNCKNSCENHAQLIRTLLVLAAKRSQALSVHVNILSKPNTREKLLTYLENMRSLFGSDEFSIPITLTRLADYLAVDRSAMMREIKKMNDEGLIESKGKNIKILQ